jgi:1,4-dihydroxy-6-naphthoate synthase
MKPLTLGFSPCPNDCFIFDAMLHHKIDTEGLTFVPIIEDVEKLNKRAVSALAGKDDEFLDISKLSYFTYGFISDYYILLNSGSALGEGCGPILISKKEIHTEDLQNIRIAIPGEKTTANFLLTFAFPNAKNKTELLFSEIEDSVLENNYDAGLIIHENRFTYIEKGLNKVIDLGEYWETQTGLPIPLGGIAVNRNMDVSIQKTVDRVLRRSVEYAMEHPKASADFVKKHAQEMSEEITYKHIRLYVNDYSIDLGERGKKAVNFMLQKANEQNLFKTQF